MISPPARADRLSISADIAPVYSLVSMVSGDSADIDLLIGANQSPHHASLKPSQIKALRNADLAIAVSPTFSPAVSRYFKALPDSATVLYLDEAADGHNDPHTWMNPATAMRWVSNITDQLSTLDPDNQAMYRANRSKAIDRLEALQSTLKTRLEPVSDKSFMVYHDAYNHFAEGFDLQTPIPIALSDARAPGAATLAKMRKQVLTVSCVFSEALHDDAIVDTITEGTNIKRAILDPLGSTLPIDDKLYVNLISGLAETIVNCLSE